MNNNMNNLGMNPMGMNPMFMNNMGMNMQPNLMDNTALNIKNIIKPYEDKIRQLEEIIKQKDFEIIVLKEKLNKSNLNNNLMNMNPMMGINMNPMIGMNINPMMDMNMNPTMDTVYSYNKIIEINIESKIKKLLCFKNTKLSSINDRLVLTYNYKPLTYDKTLEENGIFNGSIINITDCIYNITFRSTIGNITGISLDGYCPIKNVIKLYCERFQNENIYQQVLNNKIGFNYFDGGSKLDVFSIKPIKEIFRNKVNPTIIVSK